MSPGLFLCLETVLLGGLPVLPDVTAPRKDVPQSQHCRIGRQGNELAALRCQSEGSVESPFEVGLDLDRFLVEPSIFESQPELGCPAPQVRPAPARRAVARRGIDQKEDAVVNRT